VHESLTSSFSLHVPLSTLLQYAEVVPALLHVYLKQLSEPQSLALRQAIAGAIQLQQVYVSVQPDGWLMALQADSVQPVGHSVL
jgi:hypothetical protein